MKLNLFAFVASLFAFSLTACGDDSFVLFDGGTQADAAILDAAPDVPPPANSVRARIYDDVDGDDRSRRLNGFDEDDTPRPNQTVRLWGPGGMREVQTNDEGIAQFTELDDGRYLFDPGVDEATSHNVAPQVASAIARGAIKVTTFGDSLPVFGGFPRFDVVLAEHLGALAEVENVNLAVAGSTSVEWGEGTTYYGRLEAEIAGTDLFVVSLGGNDFLYYIQDLFSAGGMDAVIGALEGGARVESLAIMERVLNIVASVRALNAEADFVLLLYPNYPSSTNWQTLIASATGPELAPTAQLLIENEFINIMRALFVRIELEDLVLVDLYRQTIAEPIDPFLVDEVHFTTYGHQRVAAEIFLSLGGVALGLDPALDQPYEVGLRVE